MGATVLRKESYSPGLAKATPYPDFKINLHDAKIFRKIQSPDSRKSTVKTASRTSIVKTGSRTSPVKKQKLPKKVEPEPVKRTFKDIRDTPTPPQDNSPVFTRENVISPRKNEPEPPFVESLLQPTPVRESSGQSNRTKSRDCSKSRNSPDPS